VNICRPPLHERDKVHDYTLILAILCNIAHFSERNRDAMSRNSERVTALVKELLALNRAESARTLESRTPIQLEGRKSKRKRIRQELVRVLGLHDRTKAWCRQRRDLLHSGRA